MVTQNTLRMWEGKWVFKKKYTALDLNSCRREIKLPISLHTCALNTELSSDIITDILYNVSFLTMIIFLRYQRSLNPSIKK